MPNASRHEKETRKDRLLELLRKRKVLRHYLSVCRKRNNQVLAKVLAIEQLELTPGDLVDFWRKLATKDESGWR